MRRRKKNPFESPYLHQQDKLEEAHAIAKELAATAGVDLTSSPLTPEEDPTNWYSPINLVLQTVDPQTAESLMAVLFKGEPIGDYGRFYHRAVHELESDPEYDFEDYNMETGEIPNSWLEERDMELTFGRQKKTKTLKPIDFIFDETVGYPYDGDITFAEKALQLGIDEDTMIEDLNWGKRRKRRPTKRKRKH